MKTIDVVLMTWPNHIKRIEYFNRTWHALRTKLTATEHGLRYVCSSESERDPQHAWQGEALQAFCDDNHVPLVWRSGPASLGAGMNAAIRAAQSDLFFLVQDDYELAEPLDLSPGADFIDTHRGVDAIRYQWPEPAEVFGWRLLEYVAGWRRFDVTAKWCFGDNPFLARKDFVQRHGWYVEGVGHASEGMMLHRVVEDKAVILAADRPYFNHFGNVSAVPAHKEIMGRTCRR